MKRTSKYQLAYFEEQDNTSMVPEVQRWETLDAQLYGLYKIIGNGVMDGWNILGADGLAVTITAGSGNVSFVSVQSDSDTSLPGLTPLARNYIYASITMDSYWDHTVIFTAYNTLNPLDTNLYLGYADTDDTSVTAINTDGRTNLGFLALIQQVISQHRHIGGTENPQPVNLASEVQGIINQDNLPDLDASIIQTGTLDPDRLPKIDHITKLINQGTLTHAQLDSFVEMLSLDNPAVMGEVSTINLLQLILAVKHVYPDIDEFFVNEIAFIPGISPDSYIDTVNTTATVDTRPWSEGGQHTITGTPAAGKEAYTKTWDTEAEFSSGTYNQVTIDNDFVTLETEENTLVIDQFNPIQGWTVTTDDLSAITAGLQPDPSTYVIPVQSGKLVIGNQEVEMALNLKKDFNAQDWSGYNYIVFYLKTDSVEHGDVYFYINDTISGSQNSYTKVLNRNAPTINVDTLQNGWQEIRIDLTPFVRTSINSLGFFVSTQDGWDTSKGFSLNIDEIYLTTGNIYKDNGYVRVIYGNANFPYEFWRTRWDVVIPSDSQSTGLVFKVRTRVSNTLAGLATATWSVYTTVSGSTIPIPVGMLYKFIEIEAFFGTSTTYNRSAVLRTLYLDYYATDTENSFAYDTKDEWDSGSRFNIDTQTVPNSMLISNTSEVNDIYYGSNNHAVQVDGGLNVLYDITGSMLPRSTYQVLNNLSPSLGLVSGVSRGSDGNMWVSDTDNDRVMQLDKSGSLVTGFYGSFLTPPPDPYGTEDAGPGSNTDVVSSNVSSTTSTTTVLGQTMSVLHSIYNPSEGTAYIVFDSNLENIYDPANGLDLTRMYLKIGTQRFNLNDSTVTLLGVDETQYNDWKPLATVLTTTGSPTAGLVNQFGFTSHVLKIVLNGADQTLLNHMVSTGAPSILVLDPYEQQRVTGSVTVKFLLYNFELGVSGAANRIRVTLDGVTVQDIYNTSISYVGLGSGIHTIKAQLVNADSSLNTNIEAIAESTFVVYPSPCIEPYLTVTSPRPNQIYSSSPVVIDFTVENFPVIPSGQHLRYVVDTEAPVDYYSTSPIVLEDLGPGEHNIELYLVDVRGDSLGYTYGQVNVDFIVGLNSNARVKLYVDQEAISSLNSIPAGNSRVYVDVANVVFSNIYSPVDVQIIPAETSSINPSGEPTVLIAKLRSPSWTSGLGSTVNAVELARRASIEFNNAGTTTTTTLIEATTTSTTTISPAMLAIETNDLVYSTKYLNGHSVVQMDMIGGIILSNNAARFADTKDNAKILLGSAEKIGDSEITIGDSINQRAMITDTNLVSQVSLITWQMDSDRFVSDFHLVNQNPIVITIRDDGIDNDLLNVKQGSTVTWVNDSSQPVSVWSGKTDYDSFMTDQDLNLYGQEFHSTVLPPGDRYSFRFLNAEDYDYFIYPFITTGELRVGKNRISNSDQFLVLENDALESPFSSRVIRVDCWGNVLWSFGESFLVRPRDARPMLSDSFSDYVLIST